MVQEQTLPKSQPEPGRVFSWLVRESDRKLSSLGVVRSRAKSEAYYLMIRQIRTKAYKSFCSSCSISNLDSDKECEEIMKIPESATCTFVDLDHLIAEQGWFDPLPANYALDLAPIVDSERGFPDLVLDAVSTPHHFECGHVLGKTCRTATDLSLNHHRNGPSKYENLVPSLAVCKKCNVHAPNCEKENSVIQRQEPQMMLSGNIIKAEKRKRVLYDENDLRLRKDSGIDDCF